MEFKEIVYSRHAVERMFERSISTNDIETVLRTGVTVNDYPSDTPYPSELRLGFVDDDPIHVNVAFDRESERCHIITAYRPDPLLWEMDFKRRKQ